MGKPTDEELAMALGEAARMRESGEDPHCVAKALLNLNYRMRYFEEVLFKAKLYLHSGEGAHEHTALLAAIKHAENASLVEGEGGMSAHPW